MYCLSLSYRRSRRSRSSGSGRDDLGSCRSDSSGLGRRRSFSDCRGHSNCNLFHLNISLQPFTSRVRTHRHWDRHHLHDLDLVRFP